MKMKKVFLTALSMIFVMGTMTAVRAEESPQLHCMLGTEKTYGEDTTPKGDLYVPADEDDEDFRNFGSTYSIVPKTDTISFDIPSSHNAEIKWWLRGISPEEMEDGKIGIYWEDTPEKIEKFVSGTEYMIFPSELQESAEQRSKFYAELQPGLMYSEEYISTMRKFSNEPFLVITVTDYDLNWEWRMAFQVVDAENWLGPVNLLNTVN